MELINASPLPVQALLVMDNHGRETLLVVAKAWYAIRDGAARLDDNQENIRMADEYNGEPGRSSIRHAADTTLFKPATDVILLGNAYPQRSNDPSVDVRLQAGKIRKTVRVTGDRVWLGKQGSEYMSEPVPFERMPLVFERAFGGIDDSSDSPESDDRNPVGKGFLARRSKRQVTGSPLPNLESPAHLMKTPYDRPMPAGTGLIAPNWEPRRSRAGTFDEKWLDERAPFLPEDHDPLFQQCAPDDQVYPGYMQGGEPVVVENASALGKLSFLLPGLKLDVAARIGDETHALPMLLDTLVIDAEKSGVSMVWRGSMPIHNRVYDVQWVRAAVAEEL